MKTIEIKEYQKEYKTNSDASESVVVSIPIVSSVDGVVDKTEIITYEFDKEYDQYFCYDRCDGIVVQLFWHAMRTKYDNIVCKYPMSELLWYNLTYNIIPQIALCSEGKSKKVSLDVPLTKEQYHPTRPGMGMSRGIDSFATFYEYYDFPLEDYRVAQLTYYNVGAHHGQGVKDRTMRERYLGQLVGTKAFCEEYNFPLLAIDTNLHQFYFDMFKFVRFDRTHIYRNLGCTLMFQKLFSKYYYSSSYNLNQFEVGVDLDHAHHEKWLIPLLSTENTTTISSNQDWERIDKTRFVADKEGCNNHLLVCFSEDKNCGKCAKCQRTLMQLDSLGGNYLDNFANSFDLKEYYENDRIRWFNDIDNLMVNGLLACTYVEAFYEALKNRPELVLNSGHVTKFDTPLKLSVKTSGLNVRKNPELGSPILYRMPRGFKIECDLECDGWCKVVLQDGTIGWSLRKYFEEL